MGHKGSKTTRTRLLLVLTLIFSLMAPATALAQIGTWKNYLSYYHVQQICAAGDDLFVLASNGLYQYNQKDQSIITYDRVNGLSDTGISHIAWNAKAHRLIAVYQNANIDLIDTKGNVTNISALYAKMMTGDKTVSSIRIDGIYAYLICGFGIVKVNMQKAEIADTYTETHPEYPASLPAEDNSDYDKYISIVQTLSPGGPKYNNFGWMKYENDRLYTCGGGTNDVTIPASVQVMKDGDWTIFQDDMASITGINYVNANCLDYDPEDIEHVYVGVRSGLYEFRNGKFVEFYNNRNSPIESYNDKSTNYQTVTAVKFDKDGKLWFINSNAPTQSIIEYTKDGEFISHYTPEVMKLEGNGYTNKSNANLSKLIIDSRDYMWFVNNNWKLPALYRYDKENQTAIEYATFVNQDGTAITGMTGVSCAVEDKDGNIWIGTNVGPFLLDKSQFESANPVFTQVKVPRNDGTNYADYLLNKANITDICIDDANRKWMSTNGNGVYLISADNYTQLHHFTIENSELLSNNVLSMALNNKTGEVFFGTESGLCSFVSDATVINETMTKDNVWAYPNPVTPDYTGLITIVGLTYNADVKIVSPNGALIAQGRSNGGTFTWDGNDKNGNRVASGVYMAVIATQDGKKGTVCKIAIVN